MEGRGKRGRWGRWGGGSIPSAEAWKSDPSRGSSVTPTGGLESNRRERGCVCLLGGALVFCADTVLVPEQKEAGGRCTRPAPSARRGFHGEHSLACFNSSCPPATFGTINRREPLHHVRARRLKHQMIFPPAHVSRALLIHYLSSVPNHIIFQCASITPLPEAGKTAARKQPAGGRRRTVLRPFPLGEIGNPPPSSPPAPQKPPPPDFKHLI